MIRLIIMALVSVLSAHAAYAEPPNIVGRWTGQTRALVDSGGEIVVGHRSSIIVVEEQDGLLFRGYRSWKALDEHLSNVAGEDVLEAREPIIGTFDPNEQTFRMVEIADPGFLFGTVVGDELQVSYMETYPHAVVFTGVYRRASE